MKIFFNFVILFVLNVSLSRSKHKIGSEGDKLIEKILSANRFSDLADKIVDKAIWKINHLNSSSEYIQKMEKTRDLNSLKNIREERSNKRDLKHHKTAIDVDAVLKKAIPLADLSFRFDHFMKEFNSLVIKSPKNINGPKEDSSSESIQDTPTKPNDVNKAVEAEDSSETLEEDDSKQPNKPEKKPSGESSNLNEKKVEQGTSTNFVNVTNKDEPIAPKIASAENQFGDEKVIVWGQKDESSGSSDESDEKNNNKLNENNQPYRNRALSENQSLNSSNIDDDDNRRNDIWKDDELGVEQSQLQLEHDEIQNKSKVLVRKEGDKMFTFEKSPDYVEYHEKLAEKMKTQRKKAS